MAEQRPVNARVTSRVAEAKARVARRAELRAAAAARGRLLPVAYRAHPRAQFTTGDREARSIVAAHH